MRIMHVIESLEHGGAEAVGRCGHRERTFAQTGRDRLSPFDHTQRQERRRNEDHRQHRNRQNCGRQLVAPSHPALQTLVVRVDRDRQNGAPNHRSEASWQLM